MLAQESSVWRPAAEAGMIAPASKERAMHGIPGLLVQVTNAEQRPVAGARVKVLSAEALVLTGSTEKNGRFLDRSLRGEVTVQVFAPGCGSDQRSIPEAGSGRRIERHQAFGNSVNIPRRTA
jgi:hypothetical protein